MKNIMQQVLSEKSARNADAMNQTVRQMASEGFNPWADGEPS